VDADRYTYAHAASDRHTLPHAHAYDYPYTFAIGIARTGCDHFGNSRSYFNDATTGTLPDGCTA
jgi:hypothetical protein